MGKSYQAQFEERDLLMAWYRAEMARLCLVAVTRNLSKEQLETDVQR